MRVVKPEKKEIERIGTPSRRASSVVSGHLVESCGQSNTRPASPKKFSSPLRKDSILHSPIRKSSPGSAARIRGAVTPKTPVNSARSALKVQRTVNRGSPDNKIKIQGSEITNICTFNNNRGALSCR